LPPGCIALVGDALAAASYADRVAPAVNVVTALEPTQRGTRWIRVADPDGIFIVWRRV